MAAPRPLALVVLLSVTGAATTPARVALAQGANDADTCANAAEESQPLRKKGQLTLAREKLLVCARPVCPAFVRNDCTTWLAEVERGLPSVVVSATDDKGKDLTAVKVSVDGKVVLEKLDGRAFPVDPGEHTFTFETDGAAPVTEKVLVREGETNRPVPVKLLSGKKAPDDGGEKKSTGGVPVTSLILGGAGIVAVGVGAVFWASGKGAHDSMESGCAKVHSCSQSDVDSAQRQLLIGDVAVVVGLGAIGLGAVLWLTSKGSNQASPSSTASAFDVRPLPSGAFASWGARF